MLRARQTASTVSTLLDTPLQAPNPALTEFDVGVFEGTDDEQNWQTYELVMRAWLIDHDPDRRIEGGESLRDMQARFTHDRTLDHTVWALVRTHGDDLVCLSWGDERCTRR